MSVEPAPKVRRLRLVKGVKEAAHVAAEEPEDVREEDSYSDSESSSDSKASEESLQVDPELMEELPDVNKETELQKRQRHLDIVRITQVRRDTLMLLLDDFPIDEAENSLRNAFVLVKTDEHTTALAEVMGVEPSAPYNCCRPEHPNEVKRLELQLRCKRGVSEKFIKAAAISSTAIEEAHLDQWSRVMRRCRIDPELYLDSLKVRAEQISRMKSIQYDETAVDSILSRKKTIQFGAQEQPQVSSGIGLAKEHSGKEQKAQQKDASDTVERQRAEAAEARSSVETRDLCGTKEINRRNSEETKKPRSEAHGKHEAKGTPDPEKGQGSKGSQGSKGQVKRKAENQIASASASKASASEAFVGPEDGVPQESAGVKRLQDESESDSEPVRELSQQEKEDQEFCEQTMNMLKTYQELLRNAS